MLINEFPFPGRFPLYPDCHDLQDRFVPIEPKNGVGKI